MSNLNSRVEAKVFKRVGGRGLLERPWEAVGGLHPPKSPFGISETSCPKFKGSRLTGSRNIVARQPLRNFLLSCDLRRPL